MVHFESYNKFINEEKKKKKPIVDFVYLNHYKQMKPKGGIKKMLDAIFKRDYIKISPENGKPLHGVTDGELKALNKFKRGS